MCTLLVFECIIVHDGMSYEYIQVYCIMHGTVIDSELFQVIDTLKHDIHTRAITATNTCAYTSHTVHHRIQSK